MVWEFISNRVLPINALDRMVTVKLKVSLDTSKSKVFEYEVPLAVADRIAELEERAEILGRFWRMERTNEGATA